MTERAVFHCCHWGELLDIPSYVINIPHVICVNNQYLTHNLLITERVKL